jgi:hypothetical protein
MRWVGDWRMKEREEVKEKLSSKYEWHLWNLIKIDQVRLSMEIYAIVKGDR